MPKFSGYSGSDMKNLVKDASMGPLREALRHGIEITKLKKEDMRPVTLQVICWHAKTAEVRCCKGNKRKELTQLHTSP